MKIVEKNYFANILHSLGYKATPRRLLLLSVLKETDIPLSISKIEKKLKGKLNIVTIYRALEDLSRGGVVRRIDLGHSHTHYELAITDSHHHHLVCKQCGAIEDVPTCIIGKLSDKVLKESKTFSAINGHSLEFFGTCLDCISSN